MSLRSAPGAVAKRNVPVPAGTRTPCLIRSLVITDWGLEIFIRVAEVMFSEIVVWSEKGEPVWIELGVTIEWRCVRVGL